MFDAHKSSEGASGTGSDVRFYGSRTTKIFCLPTCRYNPRVKPENRITFATEAEARAAGYRPCKVCRPVS